MCMAQADPASQQAVSASKSLGGAMINVGKAAANAGFMMPPGTPGGPGGPGKGKPPADPQAPGTTLGQTSGNRGRGGTGGSGGSFLGAKKGTSDDKGLPNPLAGKTLLGQ